MNNLIDLTHIIDGNLPPFPGDEKTRFYQIKYLSKDKYNNHRLEISMHSGTHIDAPGHLIEQGKYIHQFPLTKFIGIGSILDVRNEQTILLKEQYKAEIKEDSILLLYTGFDSFFGQDKYFTEFPVLDIDFADYLIEKKIKILGIDSPSPDRYPFEIHKKLFENGVLIIENLTNIARLLPVKKFEIIAFPLKIKADASILRVVARYE